MRRRLYRGEVASMAATEMEVDGSSGRWHLVADGSPWQMAAVAETAEVAFGRVGGNGF